MTASPTDAGAGMPSEEEIAEYLKLRDEMVTDPDERTDEERADSARAILSLIRPAFEAKEREIERERRFYVAADDRLKIVIAANDQLHAKLAQAVEDEREACAVISETAPDLLQDSTFGGVARAIRARSASARGEMGEN